MTTRESLKQEEERIVKAYAKRDCRDLYSLFNPGHLFMRQQRERRVLALLGRHGLAHLGGKRIRVTLENIED